MTDLNLNSIIYATYGAKDNRHQLIHTTNPEVQLPSQLLSITDKPAGYLPANVVWYPVFGCAVYNNYWCLWCTYSDYEASRGGMVISKVALLPVNQAIKVNDLTDILISIMSSDKLPEMTDEQLKNVFNSLVLATHPVLILEDLASFATIINELWKGLWPEARKRLVCNVKWGPSQNMASNNEFNVVASIVPNKLRWNESYTAISADDNNNEVMSNRAVKFLLDHKDTILENLLEDTLLAIEKPPLQRLRKLSRTVELIETFNIEPSVSLAINLIRNSLSYEDTEGDLDIYVNEALIYLAENLASLSFTEVEKIQNIVFKKNHNYNLLCLSLESYIENKFTLLKDEDKNKLIVDAINKADKWWYTALKKGVGRGIDTLSPSWLQQAKQLILSKELSSIANDVISDSKDIEKGILELTIENEPNDKGIKRLKEFARSKNWSKLYAWCLFKLEQHITALNKILDFEYPKTVGLDYLGELYNESELLNAFRAINDERLISNIENTNAFVEKLLPYLELDKEFDRYLLSQGYRNELLVPSKIINNTGIDFILRSATSGNETYGLIGLIVEKGFEEDLAKRALLQLNESFSWDKLNKVDTQILINTVSQYVIENDFSNVTDRRVQEGIKENFLNSEIAPKVMDLLIGWNVHVNESEVINILSQYTDNNWRQYGKKLGEFINSNGWRSSTKVLYELYENKKIVNNALKYCYGLLPKKQKYGYLFKSKINLIELPDNYIINRLVDEASSLYDSEELELLWEQAGGKLKDLNSKGNLEKQWTKAIKKAKKGNIEGGVLTLIDIMLEKYPHNNELNELKAFF
ncbi:GAP1-N1 domain-containing protein [Psychrobacter alimentarius]|uniref:GAP1-N1 domain-containing protein n=1 Tax=Psychrobacter alimentarius TaxID=261164 RepID=UPI001917FEFD|nr:effector-associated domain EAD1-containing protein [Psychrobacter alimentarius]